MFLLGWLHDRFFGRCRSVGPRVRYQLAGYIKQSIRPERKRMDRYG